jgi:hypothetical protein
MKLSIYFFFAFVIILTAPLNSCKKDTVALNDTTDSIVDSTLIKDTTTLFNDSLKTSWNLKFDSQSFSWSGLYKDVDKGYANYGKNDQGNALVLYSKENEIYISFSNIPTKAGKQTYDLVSASSQKAMIIKSNLFDGASFIPLKNDKVELNIAKFTNKLGGVIQGTFKGTVTKTADPLSEAKSIEGSFTAYNNSVITAP